MQVLYIILVPFLLKRIFKNRIRLFSDLKRETERGTTYLILIVEHTLVLIEKLK
jgi:hypothetical protein